tara:strand:- start:16912 stop:17979 length:1068 start_codon:yes stop_codon:yes gene_type:complete
MTIYIADVIPIVIVLQSLLFALVLLTDNGPKKSANKYLSLFLLTLGLQFLAIVLEGSNFSNSFIDNSLCTYGFAYGPLLYLYTRSLIYQSFPFRKSQLYHSIPFFFFLFAAALGESFCSPYGVLLYLSLFTYLLFSIKEIARYRKVIKETQSSMNRTDLVWLEWTIVIFSVSLLLDLIDQMLWSLDLFANISSIHLTILLLINWIFYKGLKQPQIFLGITKNDQEILQHKNNPPQEKIPNSDDQKELNRIQEFMRSTDVYTNSELNLKELAKLIEITPRRLSYLINAFLHQNFMGFVNDYRIEEAKHRFENAKDEKETILEIMYDVGFNSKSSFNTLFKKQTGYTPSEYKKKHSN